MATLRIFLSHSYIDNDWCNRFYEALTQEDFDVWYDREGLYAGDEWVKTLERELQERDIYLIVLTPDSWASRWVQNELSLALSQHKQIVGVLYKPTEVSGFITNYQLLDVTYREPEEAAQTVVATLKRTGASAAPPVPSRQSFQTRSGGINISGNWIEEGGSDDITYLSLAQVGNRVTGSGIVKQETYEEKLTLDGTVDGVNISFRADIVTKYGEFYRFGLTYAQESGMMNGWRDWYYQPSRGEYRHITKLIEFKRSD